MYIICKSFFFRSRSFDEKRAVNWTQRILSRRYALTATGYKYLEIGINVGPPSYVEIAVGDHRGNELILSLETWKGLYEQRWNIQQLLRNDRRDAAISAGPLTIRAIAINGTKLIRLESSNVRLTMTESTLQFMFTLDRCIDVTFDSLSNIIETVDTKFRQFWHAASSLTDTNEIANAIRVSDSFDKDHLVDCELLALIFSM